jgi:hypothetical protein
MEFKVFLIMKSFFLFVLSVFLIITCSSDNSSNITNCYSDIEAEWLSVWDTLDHNKRILANAIDDKVSRNVYPFYWLGDDAVEHYFDIDTIYFSPEKDRFYAVVIVKERVGEHVSNLECKEYPFFFHGRSVVGYRVNDKNWRIYIHEKYLPSNFSNPHEIIERMKDFCIRQMPEVDIIKWKAYGTETEYIYVNFPVVDDKFWGSNFWKRGLLYQKYYNFELDKSIINKQSNESLYDTTSTPLNFHYE